jgi:3-oxoacyl-[acyl-carrier-protein] synthase II
VSRPFDADRDGFVIAEGAGVLVLEEWETPSPAAPPSSARSSAAPAPPTPTTSPPRRPAARGGHLHGAGPRRRRPRARRHRHINAHGTSTPLNDAAEAEAIAKVFGEPGPPVTSTKGVTGHALGAAGALEAGRGGAGHPAPASSHPPPGPHHAGPTRAAPIDLVTGEPRAWEPGPTLSNSFGFGGHNGTVVTTR